MRVAALYDIHGNLPALEATLNEVMAHKVNLIVVGGDVVLGPFPVECVELLLNIGIKTAFIRGNCELAVLNCTNKKTLDKFPKSVWKNIEHNARHLIPAYQTLLRSWPLTFDIEIESLGRILFCHAIPSDEYTVITKMSSDSEFEDSFGHTGSDIVVCGHTHMQYLKDCSDFTVVNAGSVGMPFGDRGSHWLLIDAELELKKSHYDYTKAADLIRKSDYPQAKHFANNHILNPPSAESMLQIFHPDHRKNNLTN